MEEYRPPYSLTEDMLNLVSTISQKVGKMDVYHNLDAKPHLRKNNKILSIHSSLKIEANSLSITQTKDIIDGKIVLGSRREIQEVKNAYQAYQLIGTINPYRLSDLKRVHMIMENMLEDNAGHFRKGNEGALNNKNLIRFLYEGQKYVLFLFLLLTYMYVHVKM